MVPFINNIYSCNICGDGNLLETLKGKLQKLTIEQNNINKNSNDHGNISNDVTDLKVVENNNKNGQVVKKESIVDVTEYFKALNNYLGKQYKGKEEFQKGFDELSQKFLNDFKDKVDFDYSKCEKYLVIEGTVKVPNDATLESLKKQYWDDDKQKDLYNLIVNCINNNNKFYVYFDNLNKDLEYGNGFRPRNKKAKKELTLNDVNEDTINKHKGKDLIILYVLNKDQEHVFTTQD